MTDEAYLKQAIKLAAKGGRFVAPNPMVGALIVQNDAILGQGYHKVFGGPHAEVIALKQAGTKAQGATLYVSLEPCRHQGKTPPCYDAAKAAGIARIVAASRDPFQQTFVNDIEFVELDKAYELNKFFFTWVIKKRPYITVKIAKTKDGKVAGPNGERLKITTPKQDKEVHQMRANHQAILVGSNTVINDDPQLTVRLVKGENPLRVVIDSQNRTPQNAKVYADDNYFKWESHDLQTLMHKLADQGIASVLVEPGPTLYRVLKNQNLIDDIIIFEGT